MGAMRMPRPQRCRRVCREPDYPCFVPEKGGGEDCVILTLDEFEAVRLVDREKQTHQQCAEQMEISRSTVTEIYESARYKMADALVNGKRLLIAGGNYRLCGGADRCGRPCREQQDWVTTKGVTDMKIAVTYENGQIFQHFGHTEKFKVYEVENGVIHSTQVVSTNGSGHGALAVLLAQYEADTLICGGIGGGAQVALAQAGIKLYGGVAGDADAAVEALLAGKLEFDPNVRCDHHHHEEGHACGDHGCGSHSCH